MYIYFLFLKLWVDHSKEGRESTEFFSRMLVCTFKIPCQRGLEKGCSACNLERPQLGIFSIFPCAGCVFHTQHAYYLSKLKDISNVESYLNLVNAAHHFFTRKMIWISFVA